jgi:hypothetical protein
VQNFVILLSGIAIPQKISIGLLERLRTLFLLATQESDEGQNQKPKKAKKAFLSRCTMTK